MESILQLIALIFYIILGYIGYILLAHGPSKYDMAKLDHYQRTGARIMLVIIKTVGVLLIFYSLDAVKSLFN